MRIFLAEDSIALSKAISAFFKMKGSTIVHYEDGEKAYDKISSHHNFDAFIIDINLPNISGLEIVKRIRQCDINTPIIIITASLDIVDLEDGFTYGCSEYIKKPFNLKELNIRLERLVNNVNDDIVYINEALKFDIKSSILFLNNEPIELRKKELRFLTLLFQNKNNKITTSEIEEFVWEGEIKEDYPIRQLVNSIRKKLPCNFIKTDIGIGYSLNEDCK